MATLSLTVIPGKALKGGKNKVRIAIAHNSQTRYIVTDVTIDSADEWKNGRVVKRHDAAYLNTKLLTKLRETQTLIDELLYIEGLTCSELISAISCAKTKKNRTLQDAFDEMMEVSTAKDSTKRGYGITFRRITKHIPPRTLVQHVTPYMVKKMVQKLYTRLSPATIQGDVILLSQIFNYCNRNGYTDFRTLPTSGCLPNAVCIRQNWLTPEQVRLIRDMDVPHRALRRFRDMFMLSYYLGGVNIIDLARIDFGRCRHHLKYVRTKTERRPKVNPFVEFDVPDEALEIIDHYLMSDGHLKLYNSYDEQHQCVGFAGAAARFRRVLGIPFYLTFYSARKSFAQHAFALGVSESVIDYILGHSLGGSKKNVLYSYIKVTPEMATAAVRKVLDFIKTDESL